MNVFVATFTNEDHEDSVIAVCSSLSIAKESCGDHDRYYSEDEDGDDKLSWAVLMDEKVWIAENNEMCTRYAIEHFVVDAEVSDPTK